MPGGADPPAVLLMGIVTNANAGRAPDLADSAGEARAKRRLSAVPPSRLANGRGLRVSSSLIPGRGVAINVDWIQTQAGDLSARLSDRVSLWLLQGQTEDVLAPETSLCVETKGSKGTRGLLPSVHVQGRWTSTRIPPAPWVEPAHEALRALEALALRSSE